MWGDYLRPSASAPRTLIPAMTFKNSFALLAACLLTVGLIASVAPAADKQPAGNKAAAAAGPAVDFFDAIDNHQIDAKFLAKNDKEARVIIKNNTGQPISLKVPEAFAGVPLAQFGGGGGGGNRGGGGGGLGGGGGGQQQSVGGGGLGGGGGGGFGGGGGGQFSVPPDQTTKIDVAVVCLDHGMRTPNAAAAYKIVRADEHLENPAVIELLKAFGRGGLEPGAAQAAAWNLNSGRTWDQLAAQLEGTRRTPNRAPLFSKAEIQTGMAYSNEATRLAEVNASEYEALKKARAERASKAAAEKSEARSTTDDDSNEPAAKEKPEKKTEGEPKEPIAESSN